MSISKPILTNGIPTQQVSRQTDTPNIAAIYTRVSTTEQADKGYSLPTQLDACQAMARQEGYAVPDTHVFVDDYTGTSLNRPQLTQLRDLVRQRLVQAVFVHDCRVRTRQDPGTHGTGQGRACQGGARPCWKVHSGLHLYETPREGCPLRGALRRSGPGATHLSALCAGRIVAGSHCGTAASSPNVTRI